MRVSQGSLGVCVWGGGGGGGAGRKKYQGQVKFYRTISNIQIKDKSASHVKKNIQARKRLPAQPRLHKNQMVAP